MKTVISRGLWGVRPKKPPWKGLIDISCHNSLKPISNQAGKMWFLQTLPNE